MKKVLIIDTSILCVWLQVPTHDASGPKEDEWDFERIDKFIKEEIRASTTLVLPLATIIETGNHIAHARAKRYETALALAEIMIKAADEKSPWAAFTHQSELWESEGLKNLANQWPVLADRNTAIGDATIKTVAEYYAKMGFQVEIMTGDMGLKAFEPMTSVRPPRGRRS